MLLKNALLLVGILLVIAAAIHLVAVRECMAVAKESRVHHADSTLFDRIAASRKGLAIMVAGVALLMTAVLYVITMHIDMSVRFVHLTLSVGLFTAVIGCVCMFASLFTSMRGRIVAAVAAIGVTGSYALWPNWLTINTLGMVIVFCVFSALNKWFRSFRAVAAVVGAMTIYDVVNVFFTGRMMKAVEDSIGPDGMNLHSHVPPTVFVAPQHLGFDSSAATVLGLGDVIVPGMLAVVAGVFAYKIGKRWVAYAALGGYAVGMVVAEVALTFLSDTQPALLYLYPCVLGAITFAAWRAGVLRDLYAASVKHPEAK